MFQKTLTAESRKSKFFIAAFAATMMVMAQASAPANAESIQEKAQIRVTGEGEVSLAPDMAILTLGVTREAPTAREALTQNNQAMAEIIESMKAAGIAGKDLQTSNFSIQPRYTHSRPKSNGEQEPPKITAYSVSNNITIRINDLGTLGAIIDKSVSFGANTGGQIRFTNKNPDKAITNARIAAMKDAMAKAQTLAGAAGITLGPILEISETFSRPAPMPMARGRMMAEASMADAVPVEGGENTYSVIVNASWEISQ